jgi:predicted PurR-regulated permease PerM
VVVAVLLLLLLVWYAADLLLLVFAGILVSILLRRLSAPLRNRARLEHGVALGLVTFVLLVAMALLTWFVAERINTQVNDLTVQLPIAVAEVSTRLARYTWLREVTNDLPSVSETVQGRSGLLSRITGFASATLNIIVNLVVVLAVGIYLAAQPGAYANGIKRLLPFHRRTRAGEVMGVLDEALGRWLLGRFALMIVNGTLTAVGLWLLGVPLALTLGLIVGLFNFIPNFGPLLAAVPAILIALLQSPTLALYTTVLYLVIQMLDGYVFTPLVDRRSVTLPPVLTITAQLLLGLFFGFIGLLVASPLAATIMLLVKMLYIEDLLGDPIMAESSIGEEARHTQALAAQNADLRGNGEEAA